MKKSKSSKKIEEAFSHPECVWKVQSLKRCPECFQKGGLDKRHGLVVCGFCGWNHKINQYESYEDMMDDHYPNYGD